MPMDWKEQRDREWRAAQRHRLEHDDDRDGGYERERRSFQDGPPPYGQQRGGGRYQPRGPVFGERESGLSYSGAPRRSRDDLTGPRYGAGGYTGYGEYGAPWRPNDDDGRDDYQRRTSGYGAEPRWRSRDDDAPPAGYDSSRHYGGEIPGRYGPDREQARFDHHTPNPREGRHEEGRTFWDRASDEVASWFGDEEAQRRRDWERQAGGHRGRGPEGYRRSDERINEDVHERLTDDAWIDAGRIRITVASGEVTLAGLVTDRAAKHRAERIVENIPGVNHVQNNLRVDAAAFSSRPGLGESVPVEQMKADDGSPIPGEDTTSPGRRGVN